MKPNLIKIYLCIIIFIMSANTYGNVILYGKLNVGIEYDAFPSGALASVDSVQDYNSFFGIRGSETINATSSFIWQFEALLNVTSGQSYQFQAANGLVVPYDEANTARNVSSYNTFASGDSYVGFNSTWGSIKLGNLSNYLRSNMSFVDMFNYGNGQNGLATWSRTSNNMILSNSIEYLSSSWHGFSFGFMYSFDNLSQNIPNIGLDSPSFINSFNGYYNSGIYSFGLSYNYNFFNTSIGAQVWPTVGAYSPNWPSQAQLPNNQNYLYTNAYIYRLELTYNNPDSFIASIGYQITDGLGWYAWANSGGSFNNYIVNSNYNYPGLDTADYETQEFAVSLGYHFGNFVPKIAYAYGNNLMYGATFANLLIGAANQIPATGYQQVVAEIDYHVDPRTNLFINYGQIWYGDTLENLSYCGLNCNSGNPVGTIVDGTQAFVDQSTIAIGLSYLF